MGYITVLRGYKKVIKRLMYFSPPAKCFYEDILSNMLHTILPELLRQSFQLVLIRYYGVQSQHFKFPDILVACLTAALDKSNFFMKLQRINNKKATKRRSSCPGLFCRNGVFRNYAKFTRKQLSQIQFLMTQVFSCGFCEIFAWLLLKTKKQY